MSYKPIEYMPLTSSAHAQPVQQLEQDKPSPWATIACELCGVVAVLASVGMVYLVLILI